MWGDSGNHLRWPSLGVATSFSTSLVNSEDRVSCLFSILISHSRYSWLSLALGESPIVHLKYLLSPLYHFVWLRPIVSLNFGTISVMECARCPGHCNGITQAHRLQSKLSLSPASSLPSLLEAGQLVQVGLQNKSFKSLF